MIVQKYVVDFIVNAPVGEKFVWCELAVKQQSHIEREILADCFGAMRLITLRSVG